ncbi:MAG: hypothetical protein RLQ12_11735, partial [Cyclobacteriaceae bacterium]
QTIPIINALLLTTLCPQPTALCPMPNRRNIRMSDHRKVISIPNSFPRRYFAYQKRNYLSEEKTKHLPPANRSTSINEASS